MPIRLLSPLLVNQIAAGEVIERPANVVKELVENSLDAGATRIIVRIEAGGRDMIEVVDDGAGIAPDELLLAVAPHATSKIARTEDLSAIATMGFRGEALASIASVSRLRILSRRVQDGHGAALDVEGGEMGEVTPHAAAVGTTVTIRNLFFNTPARRKFLRGDAAETGRISEMLATIALASPEIAFRLEQDQRTTLDAPSGETARARATRVLGRTSEQDLLEIIDEGPPAAGWPSVGGFVGTPAMARATSRSVRLYLNRRPIVDRTALHAVREAFRGLIDPSKYPTAIIHLSLDSTEVDVNVHPAKSEVRFRNASVIHAALRRRIKATLSRANLVPEVPLDDLTASDGAFLRHAPPPPRGTWGAFSLDRAPDRTAQTGFAPSAARALLAGQPAESAETIASRADLGRGATSVPTLIEAGARMVRVLQVHERYLVVEDDSGLVVVDQHALHERVLFEAFRARVGEGELETQRLLTPANVPADPGRFEALDDLDPLLRRLGIEALPSGPATIAVHSFPSLLFSRRVDPVEFLVELLDAFSGGALPTTREAMLVDVLSMMACKAAIKSGDHLSAGEIEDLLRQRDVVERSTACPHGRPTSLRISLTDLDRRFGRSG